MSTKPHTRRFRLTPTRVCTAGLIALTGGGFALGQHPAPTSGPAARLKPPQILDEPTRTVISRGAAPDNAPSISVYPPGSAPQQQPAARPVPAPRPPLFGSPMPTQYGASPVPTVVSQQDDPGLIESAWIDFKSLFTGGPSTPTPPFHHPGAQPQPQPQSQVRQVIPQQGQPSRQLAQPRPQPQAQPAARPTPGAVYAGPPAYRWYGWGTTTPGANAYAPTGQYPRGSASWYSQTGATPGAFPVPVMSPARPEPGAEPPAYVRGATPDYPPMPATPITTPPATPHVSADMPPELRYGPTTLPVSAPATTFPVPPGPPPAFADRADPTPVIAQSGSSSGLVQSSARSESQPQPEGGLTWQRSGESAPFVNPPPTVTVIRGMEPKSREPSVEQIVRSACHGHAAVVEVKQTGPTQLLVRVRASTSTDARTAFAALSEVPALKPYKVEFEADIK